MGFRVQGLDWSCRVHNFCPLETAVNQLSMSVNNGLKVCLFVF